MVSFEAVYLKKVARTGAYACILATFLNIFPQTISFYVCHSVHNDYLISVYLRYGIKCTKLFAHDFNVKVHTKPPGQKYTSSLKKSYYKPIHYSSRTILFHSQFYTTTYSVAFLSGIYYVTIK